MIYSNLSKINKTCIEHTFSQITFPPPQKKAEYKKYSKKLNHLKTVSKKVYYCKQFNLHRNNLKATWKLIGTLIKWKTKES